MYLTRPVCLFANRPPLRVGTQITLVEGSLEITRKGAAPYTLPDPSGELWRGLQAAMVEEYTTPIPTPKQRGIPHEKGAKGYPICTACQKSKVVSDWGDGLCARCRGYLSASKASTCMTCGSKTVRGANLCCRCRMGKPHLIRKPPSGHPHRHPDILALLGPEDYKEYMLAVRAIGHIDPAKVDALLALLFKRDE